MPDIPAITNDQLWLKAIHTELAAIRKAVEKPAKVVKKPAKRKAKSKEVKLR